MSALAAALLLAAAAVGVWLLRHAWAARAGGVASAWCGWAVLAGTLIAASVTLGTARGGFIALSLIPIAGLAWVVSGLQIRAGRVRTAEAGLAPEPSERPSSAWRGVLRWLLAGPIGMVAALAVGVCYAVWVPGPAQTRLLIAGLIVPIAWGGAMAWTLADHRILRATAVLTGTAIVGFIAAALKGFQ